MAEKKHPIDHIRVEPGESKDGKFAGATVHHHFKYSASRNGAVMSSPEPEHHIFGKDEGHEMLAHLANQLKIAEPQEMEDVHEEEHEEA